MVCSRCIATIENFLHELKAKPVYIQLGEVFLEKPLSPQQSEKFHLMLQQSGFELLDDNRKKQIEKIKSIIIEHVHYKEAEKFPFSEILPRELNREYSILSKLFSETEGITIEQYVILQKIEKVKELLSYHEMNLNEISFKLGYSNVSHLSAQFKKVTGLTPSQFKAQDIHHRKPLDNV